MSEAPWKVTRDILLLAVPGLREALERADLAVLPAFLGRPSSEEDERERACRESLSEKSLRHGLYEWRGAFRDWAQAELDRREGKPPRDSASPDDLPESSPVPRDATAVALNDAFDLLVDVGGTLDEAIAQRRLGPVQRRAEKVSIRSVRFLAETVAKFPWLAGGADRSQVTGHSSGSDPQAPSPKPQAEPPRSE